MTVRSGFCPRCGAELEDESRSRVQDGEGESSLGRLCESCYFDEFNLVDAPEQLDLVVCATCGAVKRGGQWVDVDAEDFTDIAVHEVQDSLQVHIDAREVRWEVTTEQVDPNTIRIHTSISAVVQGRSVHESPTVTVRLARGTCTRCGRIAGDYYASTVQVRAHDREPSSEETTEAIDIANSVVRSMSETGDREAFVTDISSVDGGVNIKVSTAKIGEKIARRVTSVFGGSVSASETLVTEDSDGNEVYRVTYVARLPAFTPGEIIDPEDGDGPVLVESAKGSVKGKRLATGESFELTTANGSVDARRLGTEDDACESTLVTIEDEHAVQVIDPETFQSKSVPRPQYLDEDASSVRVLKSRAGLHILPDE